MLSKPIVLKDTSRRSRPPSRAALAATALAGIAFLGGMVAIASRPAHAGLDVPPFAAAAPRLPGVAVVESVPGAVDVSVPSAHAVFEPQNRVLPDELPPTF